jgi:class 3 adenylate cyclase
MADKRHAWFAAPNVSWLWVIAVTILWGGGLLAVYRSGVGSYLESRLAHPVNFRLRDAIGKTPPVSPRLKIYSIDDSTVSRLGQTVMPLPLWAKVLKTLDRNKPDAVVIDGMFSGADDLTEANEQALAELAQVKTPLNVGSFVRDQPIMYRDRLSLDRPEYSLSAMAGQAPGTVVGEEVLPPMLDRREWYAYGPATAVRPMLSGIGHIVYEGNGFISPLIRMQDDVAIAHTVFYVAKERRIEAGKLIVDGVTVPVGRDGMLPVNFLPKTAFKNMSLKGLLKLVDAGKSSGVVREGDVVLILPMMYTGNADFKQTPFGTMPAGFVIASMLNSVLTQNWLKPIAGGEAMIVLFAFLGAFIAMRLGVIAFWVAVDLIALGTVALSIYLLSFHGVVVPWLFPVIGFVFSALTVFAEKMRKGEKKVQALRAALEGSVAPDDLKHILKKPEKINFEARERVVTLMFIDVVGFSLLAENMLPRMAFENLKKMLSTIGETVHQFGGIIDKTLGDGLLCYFGYRFDADSSTPDHAEQALRCAIKIQRDNLMKNIEAAESGEAVYPLRIGINTASCYLGDLGSQNRIDFTVVGNGVNFAKRLEGACDMHSVLIGATTNDLVKGIGLPQQAFLKRFIRIKHHSELVEAYEYDPFHVEQELRMAALEGFRKCANIERVDHRWPVHDPTKIQLVCDAGEGQLVNFSHAGLSVKLKQLLAKGTRLNITLDGGQGALKALLAKENIDVLQGEVRWGYAEGSEYVHGVLVTNVT